MSMMIGVAPAVMARRVIQRPHHPGRFDLHIHPIVRRIARDLKHFLSPQVHLLRARLCVLFSDLRVSLKRRYGETVVRNGGGVGIGSAGTDCAEPRPSHGPLVALSRNKLLRFLPADRAGRSYLIALTA
jgi:hypothetical protein